MVRSFPAAPVVVFELTAKTVIQAGPHHILIQSIASTGADPDPFELRAHVWRDAVFGTKAGGETRV